jgi:hypothetical protein
MEHRKIEGYTPTAQYKIVREEASTNTYRYLVEYEIEDRGLMDSEVYEATDETPTLYFVRCRHCDERIASQSKGYTTLEAAQVWLDDCLRTGNTGHESCVEVPA